MMVEESRNNVVEMPGRPAKTDELPASLSALRDVAARFLSARVVAVLDDVDDTLFDMADEAANAKEQHVYFDSMRELRVQRDNIEAAFARAFNDEFDRAFARNGNSSALERGQATLKLLESEALEELVALEGIAKKTERRYLKEVWTLCTAWRHFTGGPVMDAADLPLGPAKITQALGDACRQANIDIKARLVLFKQFETQLLKQYDQLFDELVPELEKQGISVSSLAEEVQRPVKSKSASPKKHREAEADAEADAQAAESSAQQQHESASAELVGSLAEAIDRLLTQEESKRGAGLLSKPSFLMALQDMQKEQLAQLDSQKKVGDKGYDLAGLENRLLTRLDAVNRVAANDASALAAEHDQSTIQLVGALFQYMLQGETLAEPLKALIANLQVPILKTAMLDKNFIGHEEHPARKLLSAIVSSGIAWSPTSSLDKDPLYNKVQEVVLKVLSDFGVDTQIFVDLNEDFEKFQGKAQRRAELLAQRTVDAEGGKATAETARGYINGLLDQKLANGDHPAVVEKVLREGWSKVLFLSYVQHGPASERFRSDASFIDRLLWSVAPSDDPGHRSELISALPVLVETLRLGFNRVSLNNFDTSQWFEQLERLHLAKLNRQPAAPPKATGATSLADLDRELEALDSDGEPAVAAAPVRHSVPVPPRANEGADATAPAADGSEDPVARLIDNLRVGNWVDIKQDNGKSLRCRLAAVINGIGKYIFVNRAGVKVAEYNRDTLGEAIRQHQFQLIEDDRLFDRALESVISNLREMKDKPLS